MKGVVKINSRPRSITVVCWLLIVMATFTLIVNTFILFNPVYKDKHKKLLEISFLPLPFQYIIMYFGMIITLISGFAILKGKNWGRFLYLVWGILARMYKYIFFQFEMTIIIEIIVFLIIGYYLFRSEANKYFRDYK